MTKLQRNSDLFAIFWVVVDDNTLLTFVHSTDEKYLESLNALAVEYCNNAREFVLDIENTAIRVSQCCVGMYFDQSVETMLDAIVYLCILHI